MLTRRRDVFLMAFLILAALWLGRPVAAAGGWGSFHHDAQHTGRSLDTGPSTPTLKWAFPIGDCVDSSPAIGADGTVYVGARDGNLYAIHPDGTLKWTFPTGGAIFYSSPAIGADGTLYIGSWDGNLYAINADGTLKWSTATDNSINHSPTIGPDGTIYVCSEHNDQRVHTHSLYAFKPDGALKWYTTSPAASDTIWICSSPAIGTDGTVYVCTNTLYSGKTMLLAFAPDGTPQWHCETYSYAPPAIGADGTLYVGAPYYLYAITSAGNGTVKWQSNIGGMVYYATPAIGGDGTIYIGANDRNLYAITPDGTRKWAFPTLGVIDSSAAIGGDGTIYVGSNDGRLYAITPNGTQQWVFATGSCIRSSPAIGPDGTLYVGSDDGMLYAIGATPSQPALTLAKAISTANALPGDTVTYTLTCSNTGTAAATAVQISDPLPAHLTYVPGSVTSGGQYDAGSRTLTWTLSGLNANTTQQVTFQAVVDADTPPATTLTNQASITCTELPTPQQSNSVDLFTGTVRRGDWWMYQHDPQHTGRSAFVGPHNPTLKWFLKTALWHWDLYNPVIGKDGTIYVGEMAGGNLYALHPDGTVKWTSAVGSVAGAPAIGADGTLYVGSWDRHLYAITPGGTRKWAFPTGDWILSSPAVGPDGTIYISSQDHNLYAVNADGTHKWVFHTYATYTYHYNTEETNHIYSIVTSPSPAIGRDGTVYVSMNDMNLYAIHPDGTLKWVFPTGGLVESSPVIGTDGTIYLGSEDKHLYAITPEGTQKWAITSQTPIDSSPALGADGTIYVGIDSYLYAINPDSTEKWRYYFGYGSGIITPPILGADGTIYLSGGCALNPDGTLKWTLQATDSQGNPISLGAKLTIGADGTLYASSGDSYYIGYLCAIGEAPLPVLTLTKSASPTSARPGDTVHYTLMYNNTGTAAATNVVLTDVLPAQLTYVAGSANAGGTYTDSTRTLSWNLGTVNPGQPMEIVFQATVNVGTPAGTTIENSAGITCTEVTTPVVSNTATVTVLTPAYEGDVSPRGAIDQQVTMADWVQMSRFVAGLETPVAEDFQRADCAPLNSKGNGKLTLADWVQAGRFAAGLDPLTPAGGPTALGSGSSSQASGKAQRPH